MSQAETPSYVIRAVKSVNSITSGLINGRSAITESVLNDVVHAAAVITVPRLLGVPLRRMDKLEKEITKFSNIPTRANR